MTQVLSPTPPLGTSRSSSPFVEYSPLRHTPQPTTPQTKESQISDPRGFGYYEQSRLESSSEDSSTSSSPRYDIKTSTSSTPPSSISLDPPEDDDDSEEDEDDGLCFPSYGDNRSGLAPARHIAHTGTGSDDGRERSPTTPQNSTGPGSPILKPADDTAVHEEPTRQVDYLSHNWNEEDVSASWRHVIANKKTIGQTSRLENASWRTWTKSKYGLKTVEPECLNRQKECDVTWLYGPLQEAHQVNRKWNTSPGAACRKPKPASHLNKNDSFLKKPILKKRSVSEVMLQKSLSSSSLVKQAAAAVQAQRSRTREQFERPRLSRSASEYAANLPSNAGTSRAPSTLGSEDSTGSQSPSSGRKHIQFNDTVEQCIAVDFKSGESDTAASWSQEDGRSSSEESLVMMKEKALKRPSTSVPGSRRNSTGQESKGIAILPSTKLKYHHDEPYCPGHPERPGTPGSQPGRLSHSVSQETIRPSNPSTNFLLDDDDDDMSWDPSGDFGAASGSSRHEPQSLSTTSDFNQVPSGLRRTPSGMFMPFDGDEDQASQDPGMFGRVVNTVNTARDIFSVIYNVGWRN